MNIHEIIQAWENNSLPTDVDALAAMHNKAEDYWKKSVTGICTAKTSLVKDMYVQEAMCYSALTKAIEQHTAECIPDLPVKKPVVQS